MDLDLKGKVAIVTGGSKGIGKAIVKALVSEGVKVVICARGKEGLEEMKRELSDNVIIVTGNATDTKDVRRIVATAKENFGKLDLLVNNVGGINKFGDFFDLANDDWTEAFELNVMSVVNFAREAIPLLRKSKNPRIINISSISGIQPGIYNPHYTITKAAIINLNKYLANYLAKDGVLVNVVCVGPVHSDLWDRNVQSLAKNRNISEDEAGNYMEGVEAGKIPLARVGEGGDVAGLVTFLASDNASWITGSCFNVDGGKLR